jgi:hypothetical protein
MAFERGASSVSERTFRIGPGRRVNTESELAKHVCAFHDAYELNEQNAYRKPGIRTIFGCDDNKVVFG